MKLLCDCGALIVDMRTMPFYCLSDITWNCQCGLLFKFNLNLQQADAETQVAVVAKCEAV
jgi:hypothetical protein